MSTNPSSYSLRPMQVADHAEVADLWLRCEGIGQPETEAEIAQYLERNPGLSPVVVADGCIVAALLCGHDGRRGYLYHVAVDAAHRGHGLSRQMVNNCLEKLRELSIGRCSIHIYTDNQQGELYWRHNGWRNRHDLKVMAIDLLD